MHLLSLKPIDPESFTDHTAPKSHLKNLCRPQLHILLNLLLTGKFSIVSLRWVSSYLHFSQSITIVEMRLPWHPSASCTSNKYLVFVWRAWHSEQELIYNALESTFVHWLCLEEGTHSHCTLYDKWPHWMSCLRHQGQPLRTGVWNSWTGAGAASFGIFCSWIWSS